MFEHHLWRLPADAEAAIRNVLARNCQPGAHLAVIDVLMRNEVTILGNESNLIIGPLSQRAACHVAGTIWDGLSYVDCMLAWFAAFHDAKDPTSGVSRLEAKALLSRLEADHGVLRIRSPNAKLYAYPWNWTVELGRLPSRATMAIALRGVARGVPLLAGSWSGMGIDFLSSAKSIIEIVGRIATMQRPPSSIRQICIGPLWTPLQFDDVWRRSSTSPPPDPFALNGIQKVLQSGIAMAHGLEDGSSAACGNACELAGRGIEYIGKDCANEALVDFSKLHGSPTIEVCGYEWTGNGPLGKLWQKEPPNGYTLGLGRVRKLLNLGPNDEWLV